MNKPYNARKNTSHEVLVDVAVVLCRTYGAAYARSFLEKAGVPEGVIARVISNDKIRMMMHQGERDLR